MFKNNAYNYIQKVKKAKNGFTIIETLVAIGILMVVIAGPLTVAHEGLSASIIAKDQLIASYLAQDAIEYVSYVRDRNILRSENWVNYFYNPFNPGIGNSNTCKTEAGGCIVDTTLISSSPGANIRKISSSNEDITLYKSTTGSYTHNDNYTRTPFSRIVYFDPVENDKEIRVTAIVTWTNGTVQNSVTLKKHLYNQ